MATEDLREYHRLLRERFGARNWWPADSPFEMMVGAILTQNTAWTGVEKAIANLKAADLLDPRRVAEADPAIVAALIRSSGYFNQKTKRLQDFARWFVDRFDGDPDQMKEVPLPEMREELLAQKGIGPETADSILLYALDHPTFVIDAYTFRVLHRHGFVGEDATYDEMKALFEDTLPNETDLFNDFHAQIVNVGKLFCRKTPKCDDCPLNPLLPR
jgi:endonuclease-3 related protein